MPINATDIIDQALSAAEAATEALEGSKSDIEQGLPSTALTSVSAARTRAIVLLDKLSLVPAAIDKHFDALAIPIETGDDNEK